MATRNIWINGVEGLNEYATTEISSLRTQIKKNKKYIQQLNKPYISLPPLSYYKPRMTEDEYEEFVSAIKSDAKLVTLIEKINKMLSVSSQFHREVKIDDPDVSKLLKLRDDMRESMCDYMEVVEKGDCSGEYLDTCNRCQNRLKALENTLKSVLLLKKHMTIYEVVEFMKSNK